MPSNIHPGPTSRESFVASSIKLLTRRSRPYSFKNTGAVTILSEKVHEACDEILTEVRKARAAKAYEPPTSATPRPPATTMSGELLTVRQVAEYLQVKERTVYDWAARGVIPHVRVGDLLRFRRATLLDWLAEANKRL